MCSLNPIYGQGITVAALEANALEQHLDVAGSTPRRYFRRQAKLLGPVWAMTSGADLEHPSVPGRRTVGQRLLGRYVRRLHAAAEHDAGVTLAFLQVSGLVKPPPALLRPSILTRVLRRRDQPRSGG